MPFVFRFEHDRTVCTAPGYGANDSYSLTGHGPVYADGCFSMGSRPNFGVAGSMPSVMMVHERCAVTAKQFNQWISADYIYSPCTGSTPYCYPGDNYCGYCPVAMDYSLKYDDDWQIIAYWVEDSAEGIDWRYDNNQVVFNPAYAINMGAVELSDVTAFASEYAAA